MLSKLLEYFQPTKCLEIGTHFGGSTSIFNKYFIQNNIEDGIVVTTDIKKYVNLDSKHIKQLKVYSHIDDPHRFHDYVDNNEILNRIGKDTVSENIQIIKSTGITSFDLIFIDGDHTLPSIKSDVKIVEVLSNQNTIIIMDDLYSISHEVYMIYPKLCEKYYHFEFAPYIELGVLSKNDNLQDLNKL